MEANITTLNKNVDNAKTDKNENNVYANMNEGENKLSITQKIAKFFEKHKSLMNISIIKNFVRKQLDVLPPASNQEENNKDNSDKGDNDEKEFFNKISNNGNLRKLKPPLVPGKTPQNTKEKEFYE